MESAEHSDGKTAEPLLQNLLGEISTRSPVALPSARRTAHRSQQQRHDNIASTHASSQHSPDSKSTKSTSIDFRELDCDVPIF